MESPVAQWLEHPTRSLRVVGSNPIWSSEFPIDVNNLSRCYFYKDIKQYLKIQKNTILFYFLFFFYLQKSHYLHYLQYGLNTSLDNTTFYLQHSAYWLLTLLTIQDSTYNSIHTALNITLTRLLTTTGYTLQKVGKQ